jgi:Mitochondrial carrier protein
MAEMNNDPTGKKLATIPQTLPTGPNFRNVGGVIIPTKTWVPFFAGAFGGMAGAILTAPLDVVKTRLQSDFYRERRQAVRSPGGLLRSISGWNHLADTSLIVRYVIAYLISL